MTGAIGTRKEQLGTCVWKKDIISRPMVWGEIYIILPVSKKKTTARKSPFAQAQESRGVELRDSYAIEYECCTVLYVAMAVQRLVNN